MRCDRKKQAKPKKKQEAVIESSEEEPEQGGAKKKRKTREKADLSQLKGPVDVARGTVLSLMRGACGNSVSVTKDAATVMSECARVFVHFLAARCDETAKERGKNIILPAFVMEAVKDLELDFVLPVLQEMLAIEAEKKVQAAEAKEAKKKDAEASVTAAEVTQ